MLSNLFFVCTRFVSKTRQQHAFRNIKTIRRKIQKEIVIEHYTCNYKKYTNRDDIKCISRWVYTTMRL